MPKDTVWLDTKGNYIIIDSSTSIIIDTTAFYNNFLLENGNEFITFSYNEKNSPKADSILKILMKTQTGGHDLFYKKEKTKFDKMGDNFIGLLLIGLVLVIVYAIKKKNEYVNNPAAAEAKEDWDEIGTSNNYDTTGYDMDSGF